MTQVPLVWVPVHVPIWPVLLGGPLSGERVAEFVSPEMERRGWFVVPAVPDFADGGVLYFGPGSDKPLDAMRCPEPVKYELRAFTVVRRTNVAMERWAWVCGDADKWTTIVLAGLMPPTRVYGVRVGR